MQRYRLTEYEAATPAMRAVYDDYMRTTGDTSLPIWIKSLGHSPSLARGYWEKAKGTLFGGSLPLPLKEMIVFVVSSRNGARYCSACHAQAVLSLDKTLAFEDLQTFLCSGSGARLPAYYRDVAQFAAKATPNGSTLGDADYAGLLDAGFSLEEIGEIVAVIDMTWMFNLYTSSVRLDLDPHYRAIL